jgi:hypothetical protein
LARLGPGGAAGRAGREPDGACEDPRFADEPVCDVPAHAYAGSAEAGGDRGADLLAERVA